jgi:ribosomal protein L2
MKNEMEIAMWNGMIVGVLEEEGDEILISLKDGEEKWVNEMSVDLVER